MRRSSQGNAQAHVGIVPLEELKTKYRVLRQIGRCWIEEQQIIPLLDGLDEVAEEARMA